MIAIERESIEFIPVTVTVDDVVTQTGVTLAILAIGTRPTAFTARYELEGEIGILVNGPTLGPGTFTVWYKITDSPEIPVGQAGNILVR